MKAKTHYDVLGITPQAPTEVISAVYRAWMKTLKVHPDLGGDEEFAREINAAHEILMDPAKRAAYDEELSRQYPGLVAEKARRATRSRVDAPIAFCAAMGSDWRSGRAVDASVLGLKFLTNDELLVGAHIALAFPGSTAPAIEAFVRWSRPARDVIDHHEIGVEFFEPVVDILRRLQPPS